MSHTIGYNDVKIFDTRGVENLHVTIADSISGTIDSPRRRLKPRSLQNGFPVLLDAESAYLHRVGDAGL